MRKNRFISWINSLGAKKVVEEKVFIGPMPISDKQVHQLIGGVIGAYHELSELNKQVNANQVSSDLFRGVSTVKVSNATYLGEVISNIFSLRFSTSFHIHDKVVVGRSFEGGMPTERELTNMKRAYRRRMDTFVRHIHKTVEEEKVQVTVNAAKIRKLLRELEESIHLKEQSKLMVILEKLGDVAEWDTKVDLQQVYQAGASMLELAQFNARYVSEADNVVRILKSTLDAAKVYPIKEYDKLLGIPRPDKEEKKIMFGEEMYEAQLDYRLIAAELIRHHFTV